MAKMHPCCDLVDYMPHAEECPSRWFETHGVEPQRLVNKVFKPTALTTAPPLREKTSAERKAEPIHSGVMLYFPDALAAVARISKAGNDQHNPGEPLHWARGKSMDQMDAAARHMLTLNKRDPVSGEVEAANNAWRALAELQLLEEKRLAAAGIMPYSGITP
jgi:hypothetical protein